MREEVEMSQDVPPPPYVPSPAFIDDYRSVFPGKLWHACDNPPRSVSVSSKTNKILSQNFKLWLRMCRVFVTKYWIWTKGYGFRGRSRIWQNRIRIQHQPQEKRLGLCFPLSTVSPATMSRKGHGCHHLRCCVRRRVPFWRKYQKFERPSLAKWRVTRS